MKKFAVMMIFAVFALFLIGCDGDAGDKEDLGVSGNDNYGDTGSYQTGDSGNYDTGDPGSVDTGDSAYGDSAADSGNADYADTGAGEDAPDAETGDSGEDPNTQHEVGELIENEWVETKTENTSTFSIDVDTASYTFVRNYLMNYNYMPSPNMVRIEEMVNYFDYDYPQPEEGKPFSVTMEMADSPWRSDSKLVMFGLKGKELDPAMTPSHNLVFLIDVSGSMYSDDKLPLLKKSFRKLVEKLDGDDRVSIVTYASSDAVILDSVSGDRKDEITAAIDSLEAGGSTAGAAGIQTAYEIAEKNLNADGNNRIILATDGDFNVGTSSTEELVSLIETERNKGIYLTILGFGMGNYQDYKMEELSNAGNGNYFYIDTEREADKVFTFDLMGTMFTIAKDVKLQVVFNPEKIAAYRLIGYENRIMANEDFNDDTKDAGEIGAGHRVTAFYEVILAEKSAEEKPEAEPEEEPEQNAEGEENEVKPEEPESEFAADDLLILKMRYKEPDEDISKYMDTRMTSENVYETMSQNMGFASSVVEFGMLLRRSKFKENSSYDSVLDRAKKNIGKDKFGYRGEFLEMVERARSLDK